nr:hypothetical protein [uncultured Lichenicoccus sp.]
MTTFTYPVKDPLDTLDYGMDFTAQMALDADTVNALVGVTATPAGLTMGTGQLSGGIASCFVSGGTAGTTYRLDFEVTTTGGRTYKRGGLLPVYPR